MRNLMSDFSGSAPVKNVSKEDKVGTRYFQMGVMAASLAVDKNKLQQEKVQFEQDKTNLMMAIMAQQQQNAQAQQQAQYQGAADATSQHLDNYSNSLAAMLGGGGEMPQEQAGGQMPAQPQMM